MTHFMTDNIKWKSIMFIENWTWYVWSQKILTSGSQIDQGKPIMVKIYSWFLFHSLMANPVKIDTFRNLSISYFEIIISWWQIYRFWFCAYASRLNKISSCKPMTISPNYCKIYMASHVIKTTARSVLHSFN